MQQIDQTTARDEYERGYFDAYRSETNETITDLEARLHHAEKPPVRSEFELGQQRGREQFLSDLLNKVNHMHHSRGGDALIDDDTFRTDDEEDDDA